ncbi:MAG: MATE family efflux transporter [Firmicutes bacterium]|nr:MATE family efflux transporter [Bacillota bacterium]
MEHGIHIDNRKFYRTLLAVAVPIALQNLISSSFFLVDTVMVGKLGELALTGTGLATQAFSVHWMMIFGFCTGCSTFYSQFWGTRDLPNIRKVVGVAWTFCMAASLLFFCACAFAPHWVLSLFTNDPVVNDVGTGYLRIAAINFLLVAAAQPLVVALRSTQQTKIPLYITIIAFFTNTILNYALIFGKFGLPRMEVRGAALATVFSRVIELLATAYFVFGRKNVLAGPLKEFFAFDREFMTRVLKNAAATTINEGLWSAGMAAQNAAYGRMGVTAFASYKAASSIADFFLMACFATSAAALILLGEQLGQGNYEYAKALSKKLLHAGLAFSVFMATLMYVCRGPFIGLFTLTEEAQLWTNRILLITALCQPLQNHNAFQVVGTMRSGGDAKFAAICEVATVWAIRVPLAFFGALVLRLPIYLVVLLCEAESVIKGIILYVRYRSGKWMKNMIEGM